MVGSADFCRADEGLCLPGLSSEILEVPGGWGWGWGSCLCGHPVVSWLQCGCYCMVQLLSFSWSANPCYRLCFYLNRFPTAAGLKPEGGSPHWRRRMLCPIGSTSRVLGRRYLTQGVLHTPRGQRGSQEACCAKERAEPPAGTAGGPRC